MNLNFLTRSDSCLPIRLLTASALPVSKLKKPLSLLGNFAVILSYDGNKKHGIRDIGEC